MTAAPDGPLLEVVAHRGATANAPEHTLAAYQQAAAMGADAVECDVRMTRDGVLVCVHDRQIKHTSNGRGIVSALQLEELEQFQFGARRTFPPGSGPAPGSGFGAGSAAVDTAAAADAATATDEPEVQDGLVLSLDRLLEYITATPGTVRLAIETKHPTRHARKVEEALVACLQRFGLLVDGRPVLWAGKPAVRMLSFSQLAVRRMHDLAPGVPRVQLIGKRLRPLRRELLHGSATALGPGLSLLRADPEFVADAHAAGKEIHVWTVNTPEDMDFVRDLGVDAAITDRPAALLRRLGRPTP